MFLIFLSPISVVGLHSKLIRDTYVNAGVGEFVQQRNGLRESDVKHANERLMVLKMSVGTACLYNRTECYISFAVFLCLCAF